jgi:LPS O-antigen subunit length determinant protein (WzzB/FepE family)
MAVKSWNSKTNTAVFDESIYNTRSNTWIRDFSYPQQQIPSAQESFEVFITEHLGLSEDKKSGFITLSMKHQSPFIAKQWLELVVNEVNAFYRQKDKLESEKAVSYLNQQISMTGLSEIKQVLAQLLQEETKKLTLIEANQFYVFDYIDPPAVMEQKSEPKRALICILSALLGGMLSILFVLIRHYAIKQKVA